MRLDLGDGKAEMDAGTWKRKGKGGGEILGGNFVMNLGRLWAALSGSAFGVKCEV
jgi:hypothetical protein